MKRIAIIIAAAVVGIVALARAAVFRTSTSVTTSTNANVSATAYDVSGILRRAVVTVNGGTTTVSVADSDGTALFSTNGLTGSYTWTGGVYTVRPVITTTNSEWAVSNVAATVSIVWTTEQ